MGTRSHLPETVSLHFDASPPLWRSLARALLRKASSAQAVLDSPAFHARWNGVRAQAAALRRYIELCEDNNPAAGVCVPPAPAPYYTFELPPLFVHAMAMPLHLAILTHARFPLPLLGLVHLSNRTEVLQALPPTEALDFECSCAGVQSSDKGPTFTLQTQALLHGQVVWREESTYLYPQRTAAGTRKSTARRAQKLGDEVAQWDVAADAGRRFALPVRDFNPIHLSDASARLLGQRSAIAHGLYSAARCLDVLRQQHPIATPFVLDVQFKRPLPLPSRVALRARPSQGGQHFTLQVLPTQAGAEPSVHLQGTLKPLRRRH